MNDPRFPRLRSLKFSSIIFVALFITYNLTGFFISNAFAPHSIATSSGDQLYLLDAPTSGDARLDKLVSRMGDRYGVDPRLLHAVIWQESKYDTTARSHAGAQGLMQLMPATASRFNCHNVNDPEQNIEAGTKYLRWLLERFDGNVALALAGYNAGEGSVDKYNGVPPFNETQNYVRIITSRYGKTFHPLLAPDQARLVFALAQGMPASNATQQAE